MSVRRAVLCGVALTLTGASFMAYAKDAPAERKPFALDAASINGADLAGTLPGTGKDTSSDLQKAPSAAIVRAQVLLDRARFSPGAIDGRDGDNFRAALKAFSAGDVETTASADGSMGDKPGAALPQGTWQRLGAVSGDPTVKDYTITQGDVDGPYVEKIPAKFEEQADLDAMGYTNSVEMLAERFHMSLGLLKALNPGKDFARAGETLLVAAVPPLEVPKQGVRGAPADPVVARVVVDKGAHRVETFDDKGASLGTYPASIGSEEKPAPSGTFKVRSVALDPVYTYDPKYAFKGVKTKKTFSIRSGPNNPVGIVWIALSDKGYGIHGTPEPEKIGKTESHGCIRLTNWDALTVAQHVAKGAQVEFRD